ENPEGYFSITPNPSDGRFRIAIADEISDPVRIEVLDLVGNIVYEDEAFTTQTAIDLSVFPKGMYFLGIKSGDQCKIRKLLIQ
ncbi:MAG: T9SS type A sorting domain-containing protein, partial [Bacteroidetes bacterium]|nr:T9SS type A sorting domain-containing protein [Bacteroidota bacterium]